jgi:hypothetical protein
LTDLSADKGRFRLPAARRILGGTPALAVHSAVAEGGLKTSPSEWTIEREQHHEIRHDSKRCQVQLPGRPGTDRRLVGCFAQLSPTPF